jgi:hypothetical protein
MGDHRSHWEHRASPVGVANMHAPKAAHHDVIPTEQTDPTEQPADLGGSDGGLVLIMGGYAVATGDNTLADGTIHSSVENLGRVTEAIGYATFVAAADSQSGATADAGTFADVSGADFVWEITVQSGPSVTSQGSVESTSQTRVIAIDIAGWSPPGGPIVHDVTLQIPNYSSFASLLTDYQGGRHLDFFGSSATVTADATAIGFDTLADTNTIALTSALDPHNAFSFVSGLAISGIA